MRVHAAGVRARDGVHGLVILASALLSWIAASQAQSADATTDSKSQRLGKSWFTEYNSITFRQVPKAGQPLDLRRLDLDLLDAAVFHETNRRRQQHGLAPLPYSGKVRQMASIQSRAMAQSGIVSHEHPEPSKKTVADRARFVGLQPSFLAENVASSFGRKYKSGQKFFVREEGGRKLYSYEPDGPPIPMHTYLSFAEALVDEWMASPGHRENLLHSAPQFLGCACEAGRNNSGIETFYCTQDFFAPLKGN